MDGNNDHAEGITTLLCKNEVQDKTETELSKECKFLPQKPYMPPLSFPQRFVKGKCDHRFGKFLDVIKKLHLNIPFIDVLS